MTSNIFKGTSFFTGPEIKKDYEMVDLFTVGVATLSDNAMDSHPASEGFFFNVYSFSGRVFFFGCASVDVEFGSNLNDREHFF